jgi:hypothetical protein
MNPLSGPTDRQNLMTFKRPPHLPAERPGARGGVGWRLRTALAAILLASAAPVAGAATFNVDTTADDATLTACKDDAANDCSLRGAIIAANASAGTDTINVPAGTYVLTTGGGEDAARGDLDITDSVTIVGAGAARTVLQAPSLGPSLESYSVFELHGAITVHISGVTITGGSASGIISHGSTLTVVDSVLALNSTRGTGGGIAASGGRLTVLNSTLRGNVARGPGAAIAADGTVVIRNSTISGNGGFRSALFLSGTTELRNVTAVQNNWSLENGGAVTIRNTILADCFPGTGTIASQGYNLIVNPDGCAIAVQTGDQVGMDPRLAPLGDYGGPTPTQALCTGAGEPDPSCTAASPAIDAANPAAPGSGGTACEATDQRGVARPGGSACDVGAFEVAPAGLPPGSCTGAFGIGPTTAAPDPVAPGGAETLQVRVCSGSGATKVIVDLEIYGPTGEKVAQRVFSGQALPAGEQRTYTWPLDVPSTWPEGEYTVKVGIFSNDWSVLHSWENEAATFSVQAGAPPPDTCTGGFTIGPTSATSSPVARGATETIEARVCSGTAVANILVDLEVYGPSGGKVAQQVFSNQAFATGEAKAYRWDLVIPSAFANGPYTVKVGVFSDDWRTLHRWDNQAATFTVGAGSPPPGSCTDGFTIGPSSATPSAINRGGNETLETRVCSGVAASAIHVDIELYSPSGTLVAQRIFSGQTFAAGEAKSYRWELAVPPTFVQGEYTVKIGVFSGDWATLHRWDNQAASFVVR